MCVCVCQRFTKVTAVDCTELFLVASIPDRNLPLRRQSFGRKTHYAKQQERARLFILAFFS